VLRRGRVRGGHANHARLHGIWPEVHRRDQRRLGGKPYEDILAVADYVARQPYVNADKMAAAGASYGGYMIDWILGTLRASRRWSRTPASTICAASSARPRSCGSRSGSSTARPGINPELYASLSPSTYAKAFHTPTLVTGGELDFRVPNGQGPPTLPLRSSSRRSRPSYWCFPTRATGSASRKIPPCGTTPFWTG